MSDKLLWDFIVLHPLRDRKPTSLKTIYTAISEGLKSGGFVNLKLFGTDGRWGNRPDYTHSVRSTISSLRKRHMVDHKGEGRTGLYIITDTGLHHLDEIEP